MRLMNKLCAERLANHVAFIVPVRTQFSTYGYWCKVTLVGRSGACSAFPD